MTRTIHLSQSHRHDGARFKCLYRLGSECGRGEFGVVYSAVAADGTSVAVKYIPRRNVTEWAKLDGRTVPLELVLLMRCQPVGGVIKIIDWFERLSGFLIVMERPPNNCDLFDYISKSGALCESVARRILKQLVDTVVDCKRLGVYHRDIKYENILIDKKTGNIKLIDFGSGAYVQREKYTVFKGTRECPPPEWIEKGSYDGEAATVWSLGVLLYGMVQGEIPFRSRSEVIKGTIHWTRPVSRECRHLIHGCLSAGPSIRLRLADVQTDDWFSASPPLPSFTPFIASYSQKSTPVLARQISAPPIVEEKVDKVLLKRKVLDPREVPQATVAIEVPSHLQRVP